MRSLPAGWFVFLLAAAAPAAAAPPVVVPFTLLGNQLYADVSVDGKGPFRFILDTGGADAVTPQLAVKLGIVPRGSVTVTGNGANTAQAGTATVPAVSVGDLTLTDEPFFIISLDPLEDFGGVRVDGMLGYELFRRFVTRFDFGARTLTLIAPQDFVPDGVGIPMNTARRTPEIDGRYDGIPGKFDLDTGAGEDLTLTSPFVTANGLKERPGKHVDVVSGIGLGGESYARILRGGTLALGGVTVEGPVVDLSGDTAGGYADLRYSGNVGTGLLKRFVVTLDYAHGMLYLKPLPGPLDDLDTYDRAGAAIKLDAAGFAIFAVTPGGPAEEAGLKRGDVVVAVDGKAANTIVLPDLRQRLRDDAAGTVVTFHLADGRDLKITLRDQI